MASCVTSSVDMRSKAFALRASSFCLGKRNQNRFRRTRSGAVEPHRSPALLGRRGTRPKLAALKHGPLSGPAALRCSARFTARKVKGRNKSKINGNGNGNGNGEDLVFLNFAAVDLVVCRPEGRCPWMGGVFRPRHGCRVGKSRWQLGCGLVTLRGKAFFFGSFLLALIKRNEPVRVAGGSSVSVLDLPKDLQAKRCTAGEIQAKRTQENIR